MAVKSFETVAIVGVGLIGGSIGLALQKRRLSKRVIGIGRNAARLTKAKKIGTITEGTTDLAKGVEQADLVVVCTPVEEIVNQVREIAALCRPNTLITDVGSTKSSIVTMLDLQRRGNSRRPFNGTFVGSHPIAGSEKSGAENARADLLEGRTVVVTPTDDENNDKVALIEKFWKSLGAKIVRMTPIEHDHAVASISHLPHVVASLVAAITPTKYLPLVAGGWLDTTRVASGDTELWRQILTDNRLAVGQAMHDFMIKFRTMREAVTSCDADAVVRLLEAGKKNRDAVGN